MEFNKISIEILKAVRGKRSQNYVSKKLKLGFNQMSKWESGNKRILWTDFVSICQVCHIDLSKPLREIIKYVGPPQDYSGLLKKIIGDSRLAEVAMHSQNSRFTVGRWLSGKICPQLPDILSLIDIYKSLLTEFAASLVDIENLPSLAEEHHRRKRQKNVVYKYPEIGGVLRALELHDYTELAAHKPGFIAEKLGLNKKREIFLLKILEEAGMIKIVDSRYQVMVKRLDLKGDFQGVQNVKKFWSKRGTRVLETIPFEDPGAIFGFRLFSISEGARKKLWQKIYDFYDEVKMIISEDDAPPESILVLNIHLFDPSLAKVSSVNHRSNRQKNYPH